MSRPNSNPSAQRTCPIPTQIQPEPTLMSVGDGFSRPTPNAGGSSGSFLLWNPSHPTRLMIYTKPDNSGKIKLRFEKIRQDNNHIWWDSARFEEIQADFSEISTIFGEIRWDSKRSKLISVRSRPYLVRSSEIRKDPSWFQRFSVQMEWGFANSDKVFEDSNEVCRIRRISPLTEPNWASLEPKTNSTNWRRQSVSGPSAFHPMLAGRVRVGSKTDPAQPVDSPNQ